jgi:hypothetical protein
MINLYNQSDVSGILDRIEKLTQNEERHWGKKSVSQMLAHFNVSLETGMGRHFPKKMFIGRIIGLFLKSKILNEKPFAKNTPTDKSYIFQDNREFEKEKAIELINTFYEDCSSKCTDHPNSFFGKFTPEE